MNQQIREIDAHGWLPAPLESAHPLTGSLNPPRSRSHTADIVLYSVSSVVAALAIDPVDRNLLFEQYDSKLHSQGDRLGVFCLSVAPHILAMAMVFCTFKVFIKLRPRH